MQILFVCTGNTCRSPMAETMAKEVLGRDVSICSAGIAAWEGEPASPGALAVMEERGFSLKKHRAQKLTRALMAQADYVIPMTANQERSLQRDYPEFAGKIQHLGAWGSGGSDVVDPWGGSYERYRECADQLIRLMDDLRRALESDELRGLE